MDKHEIKEHIETYGTAFARLQEALAEVPDAALDVRPSPSEWSIHEIICHLADSESMAALRLRKLLVEPGSTLMAYDEARWADVLPYREQELDDALDIIRLARKTTYRLLKSLPDDVRTHAVTHPEYTEPYTFEKWLGIYARHIDDHVEQIKNVVGTWRAQK